MTDPPELSPFKEDVTNNKVRLYPKNAGCSLEFMENLLMVGDIVTTGSTSGNPNLRKLIYK